MRKGSSEHLVLTHLRTHAGESAQTFAAAAHARIRGDTADRLHLLHPGLHRGPVVPAARCHEDLPHHVGHPGADVPRSEERRVGQECRSRWSWAHWSTKLMAA